MLLALAMLLTSPMPLAAAVARLESKTPVAADLTSAQWSEIAVGLRERAFFVSRLNDLRQTAGLQSLIGDSLSLTRRDGVVIDKASFIAEARKLLGAAPGDSGKLTDHTSLKRLGLIYDFNTQDALEYGRWLARQDPSLRDSFPCDELIRVEHREVPRGYRKGAGGRLIEVPNESWPARWAAAGGGFVGGRMIALKGDPIWLKISRFGRPWPPFDFMSGMGLTDISRREAEELGVILPDTPAPAPEQLEFNHNLQASVPDASPALLEAFQAIFGESVVIGGDGRISWVGRGNASARAAAAGPAPELSLLDLPEEGPTS